MYPMLGFVEWLNIWGFKKELINKIHFILKKLFSKITYFYDLFIVDLLVNSSKI